MKAVVLVGGEGTRLRPLTYATPKQMLPILGRPMLERVLAPLVRHGVTEAILSLGYLPDRFVAAYPDARVAGLAVSYAVEPEPLDTAGAIRFAASSAGVDDTFVVLNGDVLTELDLSALCAFHRARGAAATIALHRVADPSRFGVAEIDDRGRVHAFIEKPDRDTAPSNLINAGAYVFEPSVLSLIPPEVRVNVETKTFPQLASAGSLFGLEGTGYWLDTGTPASYLQAHADVLAGRWAVPVDGSVVGGSWVHPTATVDATATLLGAVVDAGCCVGAGAVVESSVLLPGVRVAAGAVVRGSIVGPRAVIGAGADLGPTCVIGDDEAIAAGAVLAGAVRIGGPR